MATSESDDFESADEEVNPRRASTTYSSPRSQAVVDSESDDGTECMSAIQSPRYTRNVDKQLMDRRTVKRDEIPSKTPPGTMRASRNDTCSSTTDSLSDDKESGMNIDKKVNMDRSTEETNDADKDGVHRGHVMAAEKKHAQGVETRSDDKCDLLDKAQDVIKHDLEVKDNGRTSSNSMVKEKVNTDGLGVTAASKKRVEKTERMHRQQKSKQPRQTGTKKLGVKVDSVMLAKPPIVGDGAIEAAIAPLERNEKSSVEECLAEVDNVTCKLGTMNVSDSKKEEQDIPPWDSSWDNAVRPPGVPECWEEFMEMPEELKSDKKFKEIFKSEGWKGIEDIDITKELSEQSFSSGMDRAALSSENEDNSWGGWSSWGVSSLINTATVGVSTLTSHVTHGLSMLEESIGAPDPAELAKELNEEKESPESEEQESLEETQAPGIFGFSSIISGVSSFTKLVESTSSKVITGGLDTLETIGKKTMEVLQEGDPGLKKKRAFFLNEDEKPNLSKILREAKEKADAEEKSLEEKQLARKIHFESLFDDCQGLVHLEALEMLSKQCNIKIQQRLVGLDDSELTSMQETLEQVKELCDLGDEDEDNDEDKLEEKLNNACQDLGVNITYDRLFNIWEETKSYLSSVETQPHSDRVVFQQAVKSLALITAFAVERFHKTAELLLIKERRSTVNEADALVELTHILTGQIRSASDLFTNCLNEFAEKSEKPEVINANITTIYLEAANASSYVQNAFELLIPILQVGAI
ncbi:protein FAM114A2 [Orussus abietinus]|uniref:protein FAM114A2 n=1 Tax=Orussus abietinus TaxID=222816 RepID=UPI000625FF4A|nr:protein FAM114A2 [Orussus abietinus]XP_012274636.1 protein FAM114A2 [Orussus abietinus]